MLGIKKKYIGLLGSKERVNQSNLPDDKFYNKINIHFLLSSC